MLSLIGGRPVALIKTKKTGKLRNKLSVLGLFFCLFHLGFCIWSDYVTEKVSNDDPDTFRETNNIMRAIIALVRFTSLIQQPVLAVTTFCQAKAFLALMVQVRLYDQYLEGCGNRVAVILRKMRLADQITAAILAMTTVLSAVIISYVFVHYYLVQPTICDLYISLMPLTNFSVHVLVTSTYLYGISLRMHASNYFLRQLFERWHRCQGEFYDLEKRPFL